MKHPRRDGIPLIQHLVRWPVLDVGDEMTVIRTKPNIFLQCDEGVLYVLYSRTVQADKDKVSGMDAASFGNAMQLHALHCVDEKFLWCQFVGDMIGLVILVLSVQEKVAAE